MGSHLDGLKFWIDGRWVRYDGSYGTEVATSKINKQKVSVEEDDGGARCVM